MWYLNKIKKVHTNGTILGLRGRALKGTVNPNGYLKISIYEDESGKIRKIRAHRLVWEYFNGPIPEGLVVDHIDGDKLNNNIDNLQLLTHGDNTRKHYNNNNKKGKK